MKHLYLLFLFTSIFSFSGFSQPQTYYNDVNLTLTGTNLFNALAFKTESAHTNEISYTPGVWEADKITDEDPSNNSNVLLIYGYNDNDGNYITDRTRSKSLNGGTQGTDWNREHMFPNSLAIPKLDDLGETTPPYADAHNLRPSDVKMNSNRGNLKFADGSGTAGPVSGGWYPGDEWKGDAARIIMYMYMRYGTQCTPNYATTGTINSLDSNMIDLLLEWNVEDPVSIIEDSRNNYHDSNGQYAQGNRNPFIDNPALATVIWGGPVAEDRWGTLLSANEFANISYKMYPNPVKDNFVYFSSTQNLDIIIYDILGKQVVIENITTTKDFINISNLNKGIYLVKIISNHGAVTKKLIKQ